MRLLLDEHVSPAVATGLRGAGIDAVALRDWSSGVGLGASDSDILSAAGAEGRLLVSYDQSTLRPLLRQWGETARHHAGVILVDGRTVDPSDIGGLIRALQALSSRSGETDWNDRVEYLERI